MYRAFKAVKKNRAAASVDNVDIEMFEANLDQNLAAPVFDLKHRDHYQAAPLRPAFIPESPGAGKPHAGKYGALTPLRQRGTGGSPTRLPT